MPEIPENFRQLRLGEDRAASFYMSNDEWREVGSEDYKLFPKLENFHVMHIVADAKEV